MPTNAHKVHKLYNVKTNILIISLPALLGQDRMEDNFICILLNKSWD